LTAIAVGDEISKEIRRQAKERMIATQNNNQGKAASANLRYLENSKASDQLGEMFGVSGDRRSAPVT